MKCFHLFFILSILLLIGCSKEEIKYDTDSAYIYGWLVPLDQLVIYEDNLDNIPSIDHPVFVEATRVDINPNEEVLVYQTGKQIRIYPASTIWAHEIVNDQNENHYFAMTYCPLTGSGVAWNRFLNDSVTTFGVSGNLYNNNLVPYDRNSGSFWSQMKLKGIKGPLGDNDLEHETLLHTVYSTAIAAYPEALILSDSSINQECDSICLPPAVKSVSSANFYVDNYFGVISNEEVLLVDYELFEDGIGLVQTKFRSYSLIVAGSLELGFIVAFINSGNENFQALNSQLPAIMSDSKGNWYDLMGNVTRGPAKGQRLKSPFSYSAKKYAWELLFEKTVLFQN